MSKFGSDDEDDLGHRSDEDENENRIIDSSEEDDDEDDEEEIRKVQDGFIVDDDDADLSESEQESKPRKKKHKHKHKHKRHRERSSRNDDDDDGLDEDDLDLVMENNGVPARSSTSRLKRLKRAGGDDDDDMRNEKHGLDAMFSDDDDLSEIEEPDEAPSQAYSRRHPDKGEFDDFIENDYSEEEIERNNRVPNKRRQNLKMIGEPNAKYDEIDQENLDVLYEIFGNGEEYSWALEMEKQADDHDEYYEEEDEEKNLPLLTDIFEPSELKEKMITEEDNKIRVEDIPERYQILRSKLGDINDYKLSTFDFANEKEWVANILASEKTSFFDSNSHLLPHFIVAVGHVLEFICIDQLEIPFIFTHRSDYLLYSESGNNENEENDDDYSPENTHSAAETLLSEDDLWRILQLDIEYHNVLIKKKSVERLFKMINKDDPIFSESILAANKIYELQDLYDYLSFNYSQELKEASLSKQNSRRRRHTKFSLYERVRNNELYDVVKSMNISAHQIADNINKDDARVHFVEDAPQSPQDMIKEICAKPNALYKNPEYAMEAVKKIYADEMFYQNRLRTVVRDGYSEFATVDIKLTEKGKVKIDKTSPYADFKYSIKKTMSQLIKQPDLFLRMLEAESLNYVDVHITLVSRSLLLIHIFNKYVASEGVSEVANTWNELRRACLNLMMKKLEPLVSLHIKEELRKECEKLLFFKVRKEVTRKLNQAPYQPPGFVFGTVPTCVAISCGEGNFGNEAIVAAYMNEFGEAKNFAKFGENPLRDAAFADSFASFIESVKPDIIGIAGYNAKSKQLFDVIKEVIRDKGLRVDGSNPEANFGSYEGGEAPIIEVIWVPDDVAKLYQLSIRAKKEYPGKSTLARYCTALCRYLQSPLLEYISLGNDITAISFYKHQNLLTEDRLREAIESSFVDVVNMVGVDINQAVREPYVAAALQYVCGLGPRKASGLLQSLQKIEYNLSNRQQLILNQLTTKNIFFNCSSFLKVIQTTRVNKHSEEDVDILDETRIHPEDYELARKMATDALDLDEEDLFDVDPIRQLMKEGANKLNDLILEGYAKELEVKYKKKKKTILQMIKDELQNHYEEIRRGFHIMDQFEVFTALTGETEDTFYPGVVIPMKIRYVNSRFISGQTAFSVDCNVNAERMKIEESSSVHEIYRPLQTVQVKIMEVNYDSFKCEGSLLAEDVKNPTLNDVLRHEEEDEQWDVDAEARDKEIERRRADAERRAKKFVRHAFFQNLNAREAVEYLKGLSRGEFVIRPSSKGEDHLAITWKVDKDLFQHLDVVEGRERDGTKIYSIGSSKYSDLDDLIENHIKKLSRNVDRMVNHEKFKLGGKETVEAFLNAYSKTNPSKGCYIFCFDYKHAGWFLLLYKTNVNSKVYTIHVQIVPDGYLLDNYNYSSVDELTNGFKQLMKNRMNRSAAPDINSYAIPPTNHQPSFQRYGAHNSHIRPSYGQGNWRGTN
ncbi:chromatin-remodeling histone chaperone SPT6 [Ascoidea rubescens DSM 1968]|uniref:Transcription elongation factor Spt6 n=1 Tax=Ascoidea rubescens DSM 1968 TaxID=1344418 RepID=A0A1D2VMT2_9ASCO|nr:transcription elongation factor Spt6 [Ascoidea rubescens DSM 1968]ODV62922.1 transcription elongation factor Spt6 [Ascoidea rubescens DSM 1968]